MCFLAEIKNVWRWRGWLPLLTHTSHFHSYALPSNKTRHEPRRNVSCTQITRHPLTIIRSKEKPFTRLKRVFLSSILFITNAKSHSKLVGQKGKAGSHDQMRWTGTKRKLPKKMMSAWMGGESTMKAKWASLNNSNCVCFWKASYTFQDEHSEQHQKRDDGSSDLIIDSHYSPVISSTFFHAYEQPLLKTRKLPRPWMSG